MSELNNKKHEQFCIECMVDLNPTAAYRRVYKCKSDQTAEVNSSKLLRNTKVKARYAELLQERSERTKIDADYALKKLEDILEADITYWFGLEGGKISYEKFKKMPENIRKLVTSIEEKNTKDDKWVVVKFMDKDKALDLLFRHLGLLTNKVELTGNLSIRNKTDEEINDRLDELLDEHGKK